MTVTADDVFAAAAALAGQIVPTPLISVPALAALAGADLRLKLENLQHTGSFKPRGALNKLRHLTPEQAAGGVIACSAGNHAQGVAYFAERLAIKATIVMPDDTPFTKIERTRALGAEVVLEGETLAESELLAKDLSARQGLTFVHPYDDPHIIAGQGTVAVEMLRDEPQLDVLVVPIGGGGLIAGIATVAKALRPQVEIIGVEAASYPSMTATLAGRQPSFGGVTVAEGIAVKVPGTLTRPIVERLVSDVIVLDEEALERAVETLARRGHIVAEGAGAAALGAVLAEPERFHGRCVGLVISGGNIDPRLLASVLLRGLVRDGQLIRLRVLITDSPGVLARVSQTIGDAGGNIVDIIHHRLFYDIPVKQADLDVVVETRSRAHGAEIIGRLEQGGFPTRLLGATDNTR